MKKKVICGLLGLTVLCSGLYWFFKDKNHNLVCIDELRKKLRAELYGE